jgi:hypothetical protein
MWYKSKFCHKYEWNYVICRAMDGHGHDPVKWKMLVSERCALHVLSLMWNLEEQKVHESWMGTIWHIEEENWEV